MTTYPDFGEKTEAQQVTSSFADSIRGKTILITGVGPNGLGAALAHAFASQAAVLLVLTARDMSKVQAVTQELNANYPDVKTRTLQLDVASFKSITSAAAEVNGYAELNLNILINNAGVMNIPERVLSPDGFEMHLATNYLGPFLFTNSIMGKLLNSPGGRTVNITSNGHALSPFQFKDYNFEGKPLPESEKLNKELCKGWSLSWGLGYLPAIAYGQSLSAVCVYPGAITTNLWRQISKDAVQQLFTMLPMKSMSQGI